MESAHSIRFLYQHFLAVITEKSLNTFYHACSYAKADYSRFMNVTAKMALHLIPEQLKSQPVFLCIDDTIISKFGTKFENVSKLFDHATHNGCNYLNGHCFVSLMLCVPVWNRDKISYLAVPLGYRMWQKKNQSLSLLHPGYVMSCLNFHHKKMLSYFVTAGIQSRILYPLSKSIQTLISLKMPEQILSFMIIYDPYSTLYCPIIIPCISN